MKKVILSIVIILISIIIIIALKITENANKIVNISAFNGQFEKYKDDTLYGAEVLTIINKAIDNNKNLNIEKDNAGYYREDDSYSIKVELILLRKDEEGKIEEVQYQMETLEKAGLDGFISSFSLISFKCINIEYNSLGRVSKIILKQLEV